MKVVLAVAVFIIALVTFIALVLAFPTGVSIRNPVLQEYVADHGVSATSYGMNNANSAAQNLTALNNAYTASKLINNMYITLPAGTFSMDPFVIDSNIKLKGAGKGVTVLDFTGVGDTAVSAVSTDALGLSIELEGLTIQGPDFLVASVNEPIGFQYENSVDSTTQSNSVTLRSVEVEGFHFGLHGRVVGSHGLDLTLIDCHVHGQYQYALSFFSDDSGAFVERVLRVRDSVIETNRFSQLCYLHPHTSWEFVRTEFGEAFGLAIQSRTDAGLTEGSRHLVDGCFFRGDCQDFFLNASLTGSGQNPPTVIVNTFFDVQGQTVRMPGGGVFANNRVHASVLNNNFLSGGGEASAEFICANNSFTSTSAGVNAFMVVAVAENVQFSITGNTFRYPVNGTGGRAILVGATTSPTVVNIPRGVISGNSVFTESTSPLVCVDVQGDAMVRIVDNVFAGVSFADSGLIRPRTFNHPSSRLDIYSNLFDTSLAAGASEAVWFGNLFANTVGTDGTVELMDNRIVGADSNVFNPAPGRTWSEINND